MSFFMVQASLDQAMISTLAREESLPRNVSDDYLTHLALVRLFGEARPQPWMRIRTRGRWMELLAYTDRDAASLHEAAKVHADPRIYQGCDWDGLASKPMPSEWREGSQFRYETKIAPTVRRSADRSEVDAFLAECHRRPDAILDRSSVYAGWLESRARGAKIRSVEVVRFSLEQVTRRNHGEQERRSTRSTIPAVTVRGLLEVRDGAEFGQTMMRGVGRHRAFGFGMIVLRSVEERGR
jgi:CRISPR system Cascade subunit CasE